MRLFDHLELVRVGFGQAVAEHPPRRDFPISAATLYRRALRGYVAASRQTFALFECNSDEARETRRRAIART